MALWRSLERLSSDKELDVKAYESNLDELKQSEPGNSQNLRGSGAIIPRAGGPSTCSSSDIFFIKLHWEESRLFRIAYTPLTSVTYTPLICLTVKLSGEADFIFGGTTINCNLTKSR